MQDLVGKSICPPNSEFDPRVSFIPLFYQNSPSIKPGINAKVKFYYFTNSLCLCSGKNMTDLLHVIAHLRMHSIK